MRATALALPTAVLATLLAAPPAAAQGDDAFLFFRSPTGNIACMLMDAPEWRGARCDVIAVDRLSFATPPADCDLDWGHAFEVPARGAAAPACVGDTVASPEARVLDYGQAVTKGGVTCTSERSGMTCTNAEGHGFSVSRGRQQVF